MAGARTLVVLDDIWSVSVLEQLISRMPGCKALVVSRFKFPTVINLTYELELLREDEAISLFCQVAFGQKSIPLAANKNLVKQVSLLSQLDGVSLNFICRYILCCFLLKLHSIGCL